MIHFPVILGILQESSESSPHFHIIYHGYSIYFLNLENDWKASYVPHVFLLIIQGFSKNFSRCIPGWESARKTLNVPGNFQIWIIAGKCTPIQLFSRQFSQLENLALPAVHLVNTVIVGNNFIQSEYYSVDVILFRTKAYSTMVKIEI